MIYYQAVCTKHGYASALYTNPSHARGRANAHDRSVGGPHDTTVIEVFIAPENIVVQRRGV